MEIHISVLSKLGGRERNEDACGYWSDGGPICCVLSDGAGGHGGGDVASRIAVETVLRQFSVAPGCSPGMVFSLIDQANRDVIGQQGNSNDTADMRATLVVLVFNPTTLEAVWGHIGDSRLYCFRSGFVVNRTKDHSLFQSMVDAGFADPERLRGNPERSVLIASLGADDGFQPDVISSPFALQEGDAFLMCSDGFWEYVTEAAMEAALQRVGSPEEWLAAMEQLVIDSGRPGQDNYSAVAVWVGPMDFSTRIFSRSVGAKAAGA